MLGEHKYTVFVDNAADEKMLGHINFLEQASVSAAERLSNKLCSGIDSLDFNPEGFPRYFTQKSAKIKTKNILHYRLCDKQRYRLVFDVIGGIVHIHDVQDCRQHQSKSLV